MLSMKRRAFVVGLSGLLLFVALGTAAAEEPSPDAGRDAPGSVTEEQLDRLMELSGIDTQLEQFAPLLHAQMSGAGLQLDDEAEERLHRGIDRIFTADSLRDAVREELAASLTAADAEAVLEWLETPLGRRITALEEAAMSPEAAAANQGLRAEIDRTLPRERRQRLSELDESQQVTEMTLLMMEASAHAMVEGILAASPDLEGEIAQQARDATEALLEQMRPQVEAGIVPGLAYTYRDLSDEELARYAAWSREPASKRYHGVSVQAMGAVLLRRMGRLGEAFAPPGPEA